MKKFLMIFLILTFFSCYENVRDLDTEVVLNDETLSVTDDVADFTINSSLPIPTGVRASKGVYSEKILVKWNQVFYKNSIIGYHVYRIEKKTVIAEDGSEQIKLNSVRVSGQFTINNLYYEDTISKGIKNGVDYYYKVRAVDLSSFENSASRLSVEDVGYLLSPISNISASFRNFTDKIVLSWKEVRGANFYYVYRAQEEYAGVVPNLDKFVKLDEAFVSTFYEDFSTLNQGDILTGVIYYYYVEACNSKTSISKISPVVKGSLLVAGAPEIPQNVEASKSEISGAIRVKWTKLPDISKYKIYRFSKDEYISGNYVGEEISVSLSDLKQYDDDLVYYDISNKIIDGSDYYYRIAGANDFGIGQLSDFNIITSDKNKGSSFKKNAANNINISLNSKFQYKITWTPTANATGYYLLRSVGETAPTLDTSWTLVKENAITTNSFIDEHANIPGAFDYKTDTVHYKVLPVNKDVVKKWTIAGGVEYETGKDYRADLAQIQGVDINSIKQTVGYTDFSNVGTFKLEMPQILSSEASQGTVESGITVNAKLKSKSGIGIEYDVILIRTCEYGDESGVYPLSLPQVGGFNASKKGVPPISNVLEYNVSQQIQDDGTLTWIDPMPDFDKDGKIKETNMVWNYARWDREAWKAILRQKQVDMNRYVKVTYKLIVKEIDDSTKKYESANFTGYPNLSYKEFAWLAKWQLDTSLNTIWQLNVPRCIWSKTVSWLPNLNVSYNGESTGKMIFQVGSVTNLTGSGGSDGGFYGDFPGFKIKINMTMSVSLEDHKAREVTLDNVDIITPLYSGVINIRMTVRDYGPYWGLWNSNGKYVKGGYVKVSMSSPTVKSMKTLNPADVFMIGQGADNGTEEDLFNYQIHGYNLDIDVSPDEKSSYPTKGVDSWHYTRINWPCRPYPNNNSELTSDWNKTINYNLTNW